MTAMDPTRQAWFDRARAHPVEGILQKRGFKLPSGTKNERKGPCPRCGGDDRFGLSISKQTFTCHQCGLKGAGGIDIIVEIGEAKTPWEAAEILEGPPPKPNGHDTSTGKWVHEGEWFYEDADGSPYLKVVRYRKPDGEKVYPQYHIIKDGQWAKGKPEGPKIPYRLPELLDSDRSEPVFIVEGEKCADAVAGLGLTATSASEGAGKWTTVLNEHFRDRIAYILPDNDEQGAKHAEQVAQNLASVAREVRIVSLPGLAAKGDVYDWIKRGGTREQLDELGAASPKWQAEGVHQRPDGTIGEKPDSPEGLRFKETKVKDLNWRINVDYLVKGLFPRKGLAIVWGPPKCGKSFWALDVFLHVALGRKYRNLRVHQHEIAYVALEGQNGFDDRIAAFKQKFLKPDDEVPAFHLFKATLDLVKDHPKLIADIKVQSIAPACAVIDTMNRSLAGSESKDEDMAAYLRAADAVQEAFQCLVVIIHHCGVNQERPRGHTSQTGAADVQISVKKDEITKIITVTVDYAKDMPEGVTFSNKLVLVEGPPDQDGDKVTSLVVVPIEPDEPAAQGAAPKSKLTDSQRRFMDILHKAVIEAPADTKEITTVPIGRRAVTRDMLKR